MLNTELLEERLNQIRVSVNRLKKMSSLTLDEFLNSADNYAISEHHIRISLESLFDIGRHIIAKKGLGKPTNYKEVLEILGQHEVIMPDFTQKIKGMAGYRNRLVHGYASVAAEEIYNIMQTKLDDFEQFCLYIVNYMEDHC